MSYLSSAFLNLENLMALSIHCAFVIFLFFILRSIPERIAIIFIAQIPLLIFPAFRFTWSLINLNMYYLFFLFFSCFAFVYYISNKDKSYLDFKKENFLLLIFLITTLFSIIGSPDFKISCLAFSYILFWLGTFNISFNTIRYSSSLLMTSLYCFLLSSLVMMGVILISYMLKYKLPLSVEQIYINKLLSCESRYTLRIIGNIHNVSPFLFFINVFSFSLFVSFSKNKKILNEFTENIRIKYLSINKVVLCNLIFSFLILFLFVARGAIILMIISYFFFLKRVSFKYLLSGILIFCFFFYFFCNSSIRNYFYKINYSFFNLFLNSFFTKNENYTVSDLSVYERINALTKGIEIIKDNFLFGIGFDNYSYIETTYTSPHNFIIQHIAEMGICGMFFVGCLLYFIGKALIFEKIYFLFCIICSLALYVLYMTLIGGQLFHTGMLINGLTLFYVISLYSSLKLNTDFKNKSLTSVRSTESLQH